MKSNSNHTLRSGQRLTPLFILAFGLAGLGAYTSFQSLTDGESALYADAESVLRPPAMATSMLDALPETLSREESPDGMDLYYRGDNTQRFEIQMRQQNSYLNTGDDIRTIDTVVNLTWDDRVSRSTIAEQLVIERSFGPARIEIMELDEPVASDITHQLAIMLSDTHAKITMSDRGLVKSKQWVSETNAQTEQTLHLIEDALRLVYPHFLREAVHVGEEWTYWLRSTAEDAISEHLEADGAIEVSNRIEGTIDRNHRRYVVIAQKITGSLRGVFDGVNNYTVEGNGRGLVLFDVEAGTLFSSHIELERKLSLDSEQTGTEVGRARTQTSRIELYLVQRDDDQAVIE